MPFLLALGRLGCVSDAKPDGCTDKRTYLHRLAQAGVNRGMGRDGF